MRAWRNIWRDPGLYAVAAVTLVFTLPAFRWVVWLGDEGVSVHGAIRILDGQVPYRDFLEILPPGSFLLVAAWMTLVGQSFASVRALSILTIVTIAVLTYLAARAAARRRVLAVAIAAPWAAMGAVDLNHHWFTTARTRRRAAARAAR